MAQKTPMAFQDQRWKAGTEGYRNWRWINLLPCELLPPSLCWDRTVLLDALVQNGERGLGVTGFSISIWFSQVSFEYLCSLTCATRIDWATPVQGQAVPVGHWHLRLPCSSAGAHPARVGVAGGVSREGGSSTCGAVTELPNTTGLMPALHLGLEASTWFGLAYFRNPLWGTSLCLQAHEPDPKHTWLLGFRSLQSSSLYPQFKTRDSPHTHISPLLYK